MVLPQKVLGVAAGLLRGGDFNGLAADGAELVAGTPEAFAQTLRSETDKWARVAKAAGIVPE